VVAHENCAFLESDPEALAGLLSGGYSSSIGAAEAFCGESFVSARKLALSSAQMLRSSPFLPRGTPVHALVLNDGRGSLSLEEDGYAQAASAARATAGAMSGPSSVAASAAASFLSAPPPILGTPGAAGG